MADFLDKLPFAQSRWFLYLRLLARHFMEDNCQQKAASLTYTTLLSLVPIITVLLVVFSSVPALAEIREQLQQAIYSNLLPSSSNQITQYLNDFAQKSTNLTTLGIGFLFVTTILTLITIETAFNQIWRVQERSGGLASLMRYWTMITLGPIILGIAFTASSTIQSLDFLNRQIAGYGIDWSIWAYILSFLMTAMGFVAMYWFIPKVKVPFKNALIAGVVIAVLFETLKQVFGAVVTNFTSYEAVYGVFAVIPAFLMWLYLSWNLILLGVEISYTLTIFDTKEVGVRHPLLSLLDMLNLIYRKYQQGLSVSEQELRDILGQKELAKWQLYLNQLGDNNLIARTENGEYMLKKDLSSINLWEFYQALPYPLPIKDELHKVPATGQDVWLDRLHAHLAVVEHSGREALSLPLAQLFDSTPIRQKAEPIYRDDDVDEARSDDCSEDIASFDDTAARTHDEAGNVILTPQTASTADDTVNEPSVHSDHVAESTPSKPKQMLHHIKHRLKDARQSLLQKYRK